MRAGAADQVTPEEPALAEASAGQPPRVTVVIPVRDERDSLPACLESVLSQIEPDLQVLVVDGRSTDGTQDVVRAFQRRDPRVELLDNPGRGKVKVAALHHPDSVTPRTWSLRRWWRPQRPPHLGPWRAGPACWACWSLRARAPGRWVERGSGDACA